MAKKQKAKEKFVKALDKVIVTVQDPKFVEGALQVLAVVRAVVTRRK